MPDSVPPRPPVPGPTSAPASGLPLPPPPLPAMGPTLPPWLDAAWTQVRLHVGRWWAGNFAQVQATAPERALLEGRAGSLTNPSVQDYLAWRRSMCWVGLVFALVGIVDSFVDFVGQDSGEGTGITGFWPFLLFLFFGSRLWLGVALARSALGWTDSLGSRKRLRLGWAVALFLPALLVQLPLVDLIVEQSRETAAALADPEQGAAAAQMVALQRDLGGLVFGVVALFSALPGLLSLFPGAIRGGLLVKTLLPGRSMGPVLALIMGPLYALLLLVLMTFLQQVGSSALLFLGSLLLFSGPLLCARAMWDIVPAMTPSDLAPRLARVRLLSRVGAWGGLGLILIGLFSAKFFGKHLLGFGDALLNVGALLPLIAWFFAMLSTYTVVVADSLVQAMRIADQVRSHSEASAQFEADTATLALLDAALAPAPVPGAAAPRPS